MIWADRLVKQIIDSGKYTPYWVDDMKTPSGKIHVGSLRGVLIHELIWRALKDAGKDATYSYVFEDQDPMDGLPHYLPKEKFEKYLGQPLFTIPSPQKGAANYAQFYAEEFIDVFNKLGCHPQIIWASELYKSGKMNDLIKVCLDNSDKIKKIYEETYKKEMEKDWYPFQVVCPKCTKESTTRVYKWDGEKVYFRCKIDAVEWTRGCGYEGSISPFSGEGKFAGKLSWKVEWPVKWQVIGITIEGAGKDHMTAGGSHDIAKLICERVLKSNVPFSFSHEFLLLRGKKMSSSKGLGSSAKEVSEIVPPYLLRFLFTRTDYKQAIDFEPVGSMVIPSLFDEYDRCWRAYNDDSNADLARTFEMSQVDKIPPKTKGLFLPRFRDVVNYIQQSSVDLLEKFAELKGKKFTPQEQAILKEREKYARIWLEKYAPDEFRYILAENLPEKAKSLDQKQKEYLQKVANLLENIDNPEELNTELFNIAKELNLQAKEAFRGIYLSLIGKEHGPKAAWLLLQYPKEKVIKHLEEASAIKTPPRWPDLSAEALAKTEGTPRMVEGSIKTISRPDLFTIDPDVKKIYPSISIGIAIIRGVNIEKLNQRLENEKQEFLSSLAGLTTEQLGKYPEIISYRKLYKEMGIDWHSRRPSPEALLRRVALNKGLYNINTCVDAYNLVVMKNRVSVGAFDLDNIKFPTILRFPKEGEEILLLGDQQPTKYTPVELAYFDQVGGYNIDFNFRDAQRTAVTEKTKNLFINVDGIYDITPEKVQKSLGESIELITKYCGGQVEVSGIIS
ncbi:lysine--tRNA ligase [Candidatus Gottesmanbacteria bacterium]|nr:lysine--tRNA ligase [Candidatus Gottesmanbacteria bacterium]